MLAAAPGWTPRRRSGTGCTILLTPRRRLPSRACEGPGSMTTQHPTGRHGATTSCDGQKEATPWASSSASRSTSPLGPDDKDLLTGVSIMTLAIANHELAKQKFPDVFPDEEERPSSPPRTVPSRSPVAPPTSVTSTASARSATGVAIASAPSPSTCGPVQRADCTERVEGRSDDEGTRTGRTTDSHDPSDFATTGEGCAGPGRVPPAPAGGREAPGPGGARVHHHPGPLEEGLTPAVFLLT